MWHDENTQERFNSSKDDIEFWALIYDLKQL